MCTSSVLWTDASLSPKRHLIGSAFFASTADGKMRLRLRMQLIKLSSNYYMLWYMLWVVFNTEIPLMNSINT